MAVNCFVHEASRKFVCELITLWVRKSLTPYPRSSEVRPFARTSTEIPGDRSSIRFLNMPSISRSGEGACRTPAEAGAGAGNIQIAIATTGIVTNTIRITVRALRRKKLINPLYASHSESMILPAYRRLLVDGDSWTQSNPTTQEGQEAIFTEKWVVSFSGASSSRQK